MTLYFFEQITEADFVGPVIIAAETEAEGWAELAKREWQSVEALRAANWTLAQELTQIPARPTVVYPSSYRRAILE